MKIKNREALLEMQIIWRLLFCVKNLWDAEWNPQWRDLGGSMGWAQWRFSHPAHTESWNIPKCKGTIRSIKSKSMHAPACSCSGFVRRRDLWISLSGLTKVQDLFWERPEVMHSVCGAANWFGHLYRWRSLEFISLLGQKQLKSLLLD